MEFDTLLPRSASAGVLAEVLQIASPARVRAMGVTQHGDHHLQFQVELDVAAREWQMVTSLGGVYSYRDGTVSLPTWAIHIHGLGSPRAGTLRGVQVATETGLTSLVVTYRNDGDGPTTGSGRSTLGATEVHDVRAAVRYALAHGASRVILFGWSMGAAIALQLAADPGLRGIVAGLVLESPVLDWVSTIKANCKRSGLPAWTGALAVPWLDNRKMSRVAGLDAPVGLRRFNWITRADELAAPTLILHGSADTSAPIGVAARLRDRRPDLVQLERFDADHTMTWNSDPEQWRASVIAALEKHVGW